jgi:hypothetical protein
MSTLTLAIGALCCLAGSLPSVLHTLEYVTLHIRRSFK